MDKSSKNLVIEEHNKCPVCDSSEITHDIIKEKIKTFDRNSNEIEVPVELNLNICQSCGFQYTTDNEAELKHEAICHHLGLLSPKEILDVRGTYNLSQNDFSTISGVGKASLARWERGALMQNYANDNLLYLLKFEENLKRLKARADVIQGRLQGDRVVHVDFSKPRLRIVNPEDTKLKKQANKFQLYPESLTG